MTTPTRPAIIGSGRIGSALARLFARAGLEVSVANTRGPDSIRELTESIGGGVYPVTLAEALDSELIFLAIPFPAVAQFSASLGDWTGKTVVDATNAQPDSASMLNGLPSARFVADRLRGAVVVKAFNQLPAATLESELDPKVGRRVVFVSSDTPEAAQRVAELVNRLGLAAVQLGALDDGGLLIQVPNALVLRNLIEQAMV